MTTRTPSARDKRIADDAGIDRSLLCTANGCPNRWTVDAGSGRCCSAHAWAPPHRWPDITREQCDAETDRALASAAKIGQPGPPVKHWTVSEKREMLQRLATMFRQPRDPRAWQRRLEAKLRAGEPLSEAQRHCLREAQRTSPEVAP